MPSQYVCVYGKKLSQIVLKSTNLSNKLRQTQRSILLVFVLVPLVTAADCRHNMSLLQ